MSSEEVTLTKQEVQEFLNRMTFQLEETVRTVSYMKVCLEMHEQQTCALMQGLVHLLNEKTKEGGKE
jgi:hypothetical protein